MIFSTKAGIAVLYIVMMCLLLILDVATHNALYAGSLITSIAGDAETSKLKKRLKKAMSFKYWGIRLGAYMALSSAVSFGVGVFAGAF